MVVDRKNQRALALLGLASGPLPNAELKRCADWVRSRTDNKDEVLEGKFVTWTFRLPPKRQLSILLNFFLPLIKLFLTFVGFAKTHVAMRFRDKNARYLKCVPPYIGNPVVQTDGRSRDYYVTTKISWLDRLPNLLSNGAPLARSNTTRRQTASNYIQA